MLDTAATSEWVSSASVRNSAAAAAYYAEPSNPRDALDTTNLPRRFLTTFLVFGAVIAAVWGGSAVPVGSTEHATVSVVADATTTGDGAVLNSGSGASAFAAIELRGPRTGVRQLQTTRTEPVATANDLRRWSPRAAGEHCQQLHFALAGPDGLHTSTPPPNS